MSAATVPLSEQLAARGLHRPGDVGRLIAAATADMMADRITMARADQLQTWTARAAHAVAEGKSFDAPPPPRRRKRK